MLWAPEVESDSVSEVLARLAAISSREKAPNTWRCELCSWRRMTKVVHFGPLIVTYVTCTNVIYIYVYTTFSH